MGGGSFGPFELLRPLGEGGFGTVFEAFDHESQRPVALKIIRDDAIFDQRARQRFLREIEAARRLQHKHIARVYRAGFHAERGYVSMRLYRGGTLSGWRSRQGNLQPQQAMRVMHHVADALTYAHRRQIIHRDVKPSNILLDERQGAYLCDFGMAKVRGMISVTRDRDIAGTIYYMSPEQVRGLKLVNEASDIYSLGVILFEMLTGRVPFDGDSKLAILEAIVHTPPPRPRAVNPAITPNVEHVVLRCLDKQPHRRYSTPLVLASAYYQALLDDGLLKPPSAPPRNPAAKKRPSPAPRAPIPSPDTPGRPRKSRGQHQRQLWYLVLVVLGVVFLLMMISR